MQQFLDKTGLERVWEHTKSHIDEVRFTTNDTLTMSEDNVLGVTNPVRQVTKSQFGAMSAEEKQGVVIVEDEDPPLAHHPGKTYSTEETVVGRWIDGKPIYRKAGVYKSSGEIDKWSEIGEKIPNVETVINLNAIGIASNEYVTLAGYRINLAYFKSVSSIMVYIPTENAQRYSDIDYLCIIEYTKATDTSAALSVTLDSKIPMQQSGSITQGGSVYHYEIPNVDAIASASASASFAPFAF